MKGRTFNPLAAYGTVSPPEQGAVFYQDGGYFRADGSLAFEDHPATAPTIIDTEETVVEDGEIKTKVVKTVVENIEPGDPKDILSKWLKGEIVLQHGTVRKYLKEGFGKSVASKDAIVDYLVNEANLVPAELVNIKPAPVGK